MLNLTKDEPLNITKNEPFSKVLEVGAGWGFKSGHKIDLDLVAFTNTTQLAYFRNADPLGNGSLVAGPDNRDGKGQGIDEFIKINLDLLPSDVTKITFALASYTGENFDQVEDEFMQIRDMSNGRIIAKTTEPVTGTGKTLVFGHLTKAGDEWSFETETSYHKDGFRGFLEARGFKFN